MELIEQWKQEILETEQRFAEMVGKEGIRCAFVAFAAEDAVLLRNNTLVSGRKSIDLFYKDQNTKSLVWTPDFIDVSASGDLAYTYGHYLITTRNDRGEPVESRGIFHTVWKRQKDKTWRFVWD